MRSKGKTLTMDSLEDEDITPDCDSREYYLRAVRLFLSKYERASHDPHDWRCRIWEDDILSNDGLLVHALQYLYWLHEAEVGGAFDFDESCEDTTDAYSGQDEMESTEDYRIISSCHCREDYLTAVRQFLSKYERASQEPHDWRCRIWEDDILSNVGLLVHALQYLDWLHEGEVGGAFDVDESNDNTSDVYIGQDDMAEVFSYDHETADVEEKYGDAKGFAGIADFLSGL